MGRKSTIKQLDPRIREAVDAAVRDGRATIDQIVGIVEGMGGEASRSAVGRYVKNANEQMEKFKQAKEIAKVWVGKIEEEPDGDMGRMLSEMLRTVAWQTIGNFDESEEGASAGELMFIAKAIKELAQADKLSADRELAIRKATLAAAAKAADKVSAKQGITKETRDEIRREILGVG